MKKRNIFIVFMVCILLCLPISVSAKNKSAPVKKTIYVNQTVKLKLPSTVKKVKNTLKWKTGNTKILHVTQSGKITGLKPGVTTVTVVSKKNKSIKQIYKITVKEFESKVLDVKLSKISDVNYRMGNFIDDKYVVLNSKKELDNFVKKMDSVYKSSISGLYEEGASSTENKFKKTDFYKKLKKYKKKYFKAKTLCLLESALPSSMQKVQEGDFLCVQKKSGKVYGQLELNYMQTEGGMTTDMFYETYFIELNKSDADMLQGYEIKVK